MSVVMLLLSAALASGPANDGPWQKALTNIAPLNHVSQSFAAASNAIENIQSGFDGWARFKFDPPIPTHPGDTLDMQLHDTGKVIFGWKYTGNTYAGGRMYAARGPDDRYDFRFRVNPK